MNITYLPNNVLKIDEARITFRDFSGTSKYRKPDEYSFALVIPDDETANELIARGWNVTIKPPREEGEDVFRFLRVKFKFTKRGGPVIYLVTNGIANKLDEETMSQLDRCDIESVRMDLRAYDWEDDAGKTGRTAYLNSICVTQKVDRFTAEFEDKVQRVINIMKTMPPEDIEQVLSYFSG